MPFMGTWVRESAGKLKFVATFSDNVLVANLHVQDTLGGDTVGQKSYGQTELSKGVSLDLERGHYYVLVLFVFPVSQSHGCSAKVVMTADSDKLFDGTCNATVDQSNFIFQLQVD
ncbi:MAG: hypothetical protein ABR961_10740 [Thermoanaerobaculaceae bacterium]